VIAGTEEEMPLQYSKVSMYLSSSVRLMWCVPA